MTRTLCTWRSRLCPDAIAALDGGIFALGSYHLDTATGRKTGELTLLTARATTPEAAETSTCSDTTAELAPGQLGDSPLSWAPQWSGECDAVFDVRACGARVLASASAGGARVDLWSLERGAMEEGADSPARLDPRASLLLTPDALEVSALCVESHGGSGEQGLSTGACGQAPLSRDPSDVELAVSRSDGCISLCAGGGQAPLREVASWRAHSLAGCPIEVWCLAAPPPYAGGGGGGAGGVASTTLWSGGDDGCLKGWDTRVGGSAPTFVSASSHGSGVTSIAWHPARQHCVATGSYDESVRLWDARAVGRGPTAQLSVGGGVWRLRWHPSQGELLAAACMYGGARVLLLEGGGEAEAPEVLASAAHHTRHESITYGLEWVAPSMLPAATTREGGALGSFALATCSFYDRGLHLWRV